MLWHGNTSIYTCTRVSALDCKTALFWRAYGPERATEDKNVGTNADVAGLKARSKLNRRDRKPELAPEDLAEQIQHLLMDSAVIG
jgi:hypothetical protein